MKFDFRSILPAVLVILIVSAACSLFNPAPEPPEPPEEPFFGPTAGGLKFEPESLPEAKIGEPYQAEIDITQNVTPVGDIYLSKGVLPAGLELVLLDGQDAAIISGISEETGTFTFTLSAWCFGTQVSGQTGEKEYSLVVEN